MKRWGIQVWVWTGLAMRALRGWTVRQVVIAAVSSVLVAVLIGVATVLIPNPVFARDIPPVWWNYPVWLVTSVMSGMLIATYVRPSVTADPAMPPLADASADSTGNLGAGSDGGAGVVEREVRRTSRLGLAGGFLAWFAVGCPVCNKIALLALGYSGAITWFAPIQPFLALGALVLTGAALLWRLRGQVACPLPAAPAAVAA